MSSGDRSSIHPPHIDTSLDNLAQDKGLNKLLKTIVNEIKQYSEAQIDHIRQTARIGLALSMEHHLDKLLEMIIDEARTLTNADGATLYRMNKESQSLCFEILQNETMKLRKGGTSRVKVDLIDVPLYKDGKPNHSNVSSYVALTGEMVNIPDVYEAEGFDFTGTRQYDAATGYRSRSMLVIPMRNYKGEVIGVLQLLNALDPKTREVVPFLPEYSELIGSLASQAAVALTNSQLILELRSAIKTIKNLFNSFIESIAKAIDKKSKFTGGHIRRVVELTRLIAENINATDDGPFKDRRFSNDEMEELRLAALMHDVGKITTPEHVINKATKLEAIFDRIELVETRFELIAALIENEHLKQKNQLFQHGNINYETIQKLDENFNEKIKKLREDMAFIHSCNQPSESNVEDYSDRIREIAKRKYVLNNKEYEYLNADEVQNLCVYKGTLTDEERQIANDHVLMTGNILKQLQFPEHLKNVPKYAEQHHEKLDGSGYPNHLSAKDLPLQSRIIAFADIFEALTSSDRPYKKSMKISEAIKMLKEMKDKNSVDPDIFDLFVKYKIYRDYAVEELSSEQIDE